METTARELNQHTGQFLDRVEGGEMFTVTRNGRPIATLRPYGEVDDPPVYPFRTEPMGVPADIPTFEDDPDLSKRVGELMHGFGERR